MLRQKCNRYRLGKFGESCHLQFSGFGCIKFWFSVDQNCSVCSSQWRMICICVQGAKREMANVSTSTDKKNVYYEYPDCDIQWFCKHFEYSSCFSRRQQTRFVSTWSKWTVQSVSQLFQRILLKPGISNLKGKENSLREKCVQWKEICIWDNQVCDSGVQLNWEFWTLFWVSVSLFFIAWEGEK